MRKREELINNRDLLFDKVYGALSGIAIGDSFGDASRMAENRANYQVTTDFNKGASWSTDDTEFALLTAKTLIRCRGKLTKEEVEKSWMEDVVTQDDYERGGKSEIEASDNLRKGIRAPQSGKFNTYNMSDGSSMRIGPIGILCAGDVERAKEYARIESEISHYGDGIWGAQAVAAAVAVAMVDGTIKEILDAAMECLPKDSWVYFNMQKAFEILDNNDGDLLASWMELHDFLRCTTWATTAEALPSAFACLRCVNDDFRKGVIVAGNWGRDADTIGAIAGVILGAKYGASNMPERWIEKTRYPSGTCLKFTKGIDIKDYAEKIADIMTEE
ncbi:ADP-ribosylglycohydrolase family protein [Oribacterium sp. WCC10]|uniref:ADP-ribosylglycohydrolase family protein n=1 Tax=Oribacterium sp. WCC10 TaxID=1855343 RepID=UPI0008F0DE19|nr:ADP-ribosylglycohydrolase family protein [Oribacterium sp. WCC10]SFG43169.1 ADP-ribosylglycohydrolase [Oribacterium sp. WCC10]